MQFILSTLGLSVIGFYAYMAVAFFRRASVDHADWSFQKKAIYAVTWPATAWMSAGNPAKK